MAKRAALFHDCELRSVFSSLPHAKFSFLILRREARSSSEVANFAALSLTSRIGHFSAVFAGEKWQNVLPCGKAARWATFTGRAACKVARCAALWLTSTTSHFSPWLLIKKWRKLLVS
ncbi:MAG: hypothetical protein Q4B77_05495 [Coriobacteriaceae bacterium]|nr:hypothetical protein [Coriobacteriaceae bacterium]